VLILLTLAAVVLPGGSTGAGEGRIPIAASTTIEQPGHYVVVRDIESSNWDVIIINSSNVTLDLGGHTITRMGSTGRPVYIWSGATNVTVRNGRLKGGESGVDQHSASPRATIRLEDLDIDGAAQFGIRLWKLEHVEILRCRVTGNVAVNGIGLSGGTGTFSGRIIENVVENAQGYGISLKGLEGGEIRDNQVLNPGGNGSANGLELWSELSWDAGGNRVSGNTIRGSGRDGMRVSADVPGNIIIGNTVTGSTADGIRLFSHGNRVVGNIASSNGGNGFRFTSAYNLIRDNHAVGNAGDGLHLTWLYSLIESNTSAGNAGYGLYFTSSGSNAYRDNMLRGNTAGAVGGSANIDAGGNVQ
jgi:parallel beta-helix repeat protein